MVRSTAVLVDPPTHGVLTLNPDGSFSYAPDLDFNGRDTFTYRSDDGSATSVTAATVVIASREYRWVESLYSSILGRAAGSVTEPEILFWGGAWRTGSSRQQVVTALNDSTEARTNVINSLYQQYLGRAADAGALVDLLRA